MFTLTHPLQHISGKDHDKTPRKITKALEAEQSPISVLLMTLMAQQESKNWQNQLSVSIKPPQHMEISAEKTKLMTNNTSRINTEIKINGQKLETVTSFKYLGSAITDEGSQPEILSRIAQTTTALTKLKPVWNDRSISLSSKIHLPVCLWILDPHSRAPKKNTSNGNEVLPPDTTHYIQRPCYQRESPCQDPTGNRTI